MRAIKKIPIIYPILILLNKIIVTGTFFIKQPSQKEKLEEILEYTKKLDCKIFVETGTYEGDTLMGCKNFFEKLYSIELNHNFFVRNKERFKDIDKIKLFEGNSGDLLEKIVKKINKPTLYWLDAHYSGGDTARGPEDSPIIKELNSILNHHSTKCILIDDARCFNGKNGYPKIKNLKKIIEYNKNKNRYTLKVKNDIIRITKL